MTSPRPPLPGPSNLVNIDGTLYFTANESVVGRELWKTDSTGNAVLLQGGWLYPSNLTNVNGTLYFTDYDDTNRGNLWKIDSMGTPTVVSNINTFTNPSYPSNLTNIDGMLYFVVTDSINRGEQLWKIDNTGDAVLVKNISPGIDSSDSSSFTKVNGTLYFVTDRYINSSPDGFDTTAERKLWKIDNTGDVVLVKNLSPGINPSYPSRLTNINDTLYFTVNDVTAGAGLWKINSSGNAVLVKGTNLAAGSPYSPHLTDVDGTIYFTSDAVTNGGELWKINSSGNAVLVKDISPGADLSGARYLTNVNGTLYFSATNSINGRELWKIDSVGNAVLLKDINPGADSSYPTDLININGTLYFNATNSINGTELWKVDSSGDAVLLKDINLGADPSYPSKLINVNGTPYFTATNSINGTELWKINGSGNAVLVKDINPGADSSDPTDLIKVNDTLYFTAFDANTGRELWKVDNTGNAVLVKDINAGDTLNQLFNRNLLETTSQITGVSIQAISQKNTNKVNEIGFFNVDDRNGNINGIAPTEAGYINAAIKRSKSILTTLGGDFFNTDKQDINLDPNKIYQFFEIEGGSLSDVSQKLAKGEVPTNIRLSIPDQNGNSPIKITGTSIQSGYDISINNDELVLKVTKLDDENIRYRPIGSASQGKIEGRIIDLTNYANQSLRVNITTKSDAVYQSQIGFYVVKDTLGTIELADGTTVKPGDANYAMVAVKNAITNAELQLNRIDSKAGQIIAGGQIYAPVVVTKGTMNDFVNQTSNNIQSYFNYVSANTDNVDHFRQIGVNTFGVEDMYGGGDRDFNDIVIQMNISLGLPK